MFERSSLTSTHVLGNYPMTQTTILNNILKLHFAHWHLSRIKCLSYLIMGLFQVKTVNLTEIAHCTRQNYIGYIGFQIKIREASMLLCPLCRAFHSSAP